MAAIKINGITADFSTVDLMELSEEDFGRLHSSPFLTIKVGPEGRATVTRLGGIIDEYVTAAGIAKVTGEGYTFTNFVAIWADTVHNSDGSIGSGFFCALAYGSKGGTSYPLFFYWEY